jgi:hypothetical protein
MSCYICIIEGVRKSSGPRAIIMMEKGDEPPTFEISQRWPIGGNSATGALGADS